MNQKNKKIIQKIVLGGVVIREGKILILQRHKDEDVYPNMWELPSGKREPLEPSEDSLIREVKEETGLDIKIIMPFSVFDYQVEKLDEIRDSTQINFLVTPINNKEVKLSEEHQAFAWITKDEIDKYELTDATKKVIREAFEIAAKIVL
jgi:8-oxo-dGTP diphosphatase